MRCVRTLRARGGALALALAMTVTIPAGSARAALGEPAVPEPGAAGPAVPEPGATQPGAMQPEATAVVGLDATNVAVGARLSQALRRAFASRGLSGGGEANLSELRLALGCRTDAPACLAQGGELLGAQTLVYGTLREGEASWDLEIWIVEVDPPTVVEHQMLSFGRAELQPSQVDTTARRVVERLLPAPDDERPTVESEPGLEPVIEFEPEPNAEEGASGRLVWGMQRPVPAWKKAALGSSAGVALVLGGAWVGMQVWLRADGVGFRKKLLAMAEESVQDDKALNDVPTTLPETVNLCDYAEARPTDPQTGEVLGEPGQVRNAGIVKLCGDADAVRRASLGVGIGALASVLSTAVFTTLLFVHREPERARAQARRQLHLGLALGRGRGATLSLGGRF